MIEMLSRVGHELEKPKPQKCQNNYRATIVVEVLREWKAYCDLKGIKSEFVFPSTKTDGMRTYSGLRSLFRRLIERNNLQGEDMTLYSLRHTFATILLEQRENPKVVMNLMGHTKVKTTLGLYSHVVGDAVYESTAQTLDTVYAALTLKKPCKCCRINGFG